MDFVYSGIKYRDKGNGLIVLGFEDDYPEEVVIPAFINNVPVVEIGQEAFATKHIRTIFLPDSLTYIRERAFALCHELERVTFDKPNGFGNPMPLVIEEHAFWCCQMLKTVTTSDRIVQVREAAFDKCDKLEQLQCFISQIERLALRDCHQLTRLVFAKDAILEQNSLCNTRLQDILFLGKADIEWWTLSYIKNKNVKMFCSPHSNLIELAYDGFPIKISDKHILQQFGVI
jgi:hypothetical protein